MGKKLRDTLEIKGGIYQGEIPLFYIKEVGNSISVHLSFDHSYLFSKSNRKDIAKELENLFKIRKESEKKFWETVIFKFTIVPLKILKMQKATYSPKKDEGQDDSEKWFRSAWFLKTFDFYDEYPKLLDFTQEPPYALIREIMYGPAKQKESEKIKLSATSKVSDPVKEETKPLKKKKISALDKIKSKKSKASSGDVSSSEGTANKKSKKDVLSRLKKKKKASKVK